jgi:hypothetical protein
VSATSNRPDQEGFPAPGVVASGRGAAGAAAAAPGLEFRPYRRFVSLVVLTFIVVGSSYLLLSVGVSIYRQRHAVPTGSKVSLQMTREELRGCWQELSDVSHSLEKHLENSHYLLDGYDQGEAQRWGDEGAYWRNQCKVLGERCRFQSGVVAGTPKEMEEMISAFRELRETETIYTKELLHFGREQAPRLDRVRERIRRIGQRLDRDQAGSGDHRP